MSLSILVAEDDPGMRTLLVDLLSLADFDVRAAPDGDVARALIGEEPPDVLLLDVHMPRVDGPVLVESLRRDGITLPTVLMSARTQPIPLNDVVFLAKPFELDEILAAVEQARRLLRPALSGGIAAL